MAKSTYVVSANRAGQSTVVNETTTKTYSVAQPAVLQENGTGGSGGTGASSVRVLVMA